MPDDDDFYAKIELFKVHFSENCLFGVRFFISEKSQPLVNLWSTFEVKRGIKPDIMVNLWSTFDLFLHKVYFFKNSYISALRRVFLVKSI